MVSLVLLCRGITAGFGSPKLFLTGKRGSPTALRMGAQSLGQVGSAKARVKQASIVADLARFFPEATPVRIPVQLMRKSSTLENQPSNLDLPENTVIEFGTPREVLFACTTPLEFADVLRLRNSDGSLDTEASVVALQYRPGTTIVAARFLTSVPNWIVKS
jgi:hypothetical protein